MEFGWDEQQQRFRATVRAFLAANLPADWESLAHGPGSAAQSVFSKIFCAKLAEAGLLVPHWPARWGGRDADPWTLFILAEEMWMAGEPRGGQYMNVNWIGPTLMRFGSDEQQARYIPPMAEGSTIWCQGFSEPEAGSDLVSVRTRAELDGEDYCINGQKIWTSYAGHADTCFLLARTAPGRDGLSIFLLPMDTRGITVRQIPSLIGEGDIHEVFFTDVFVPEHNRLGEEGQAWDIITYALQNERIGIPRYAFSRRILDRAAEKLKADGRFENPIIRDRLGRAVALCEAARMMVYRVVDQRSKQAPPDAYGNLARWAIIKADHAVSDFMTEYMPEGLLGDDQMQIAHHQRAIAAGIASGAAEIQLNLAARRYLDLPAEPRAK